MSGSDNNTKRTQLAVNRRTFVGDGLRVAGVVGLTGLAGFLVGRKSDAAETVWQLDPNKCVACENCATHCVLDKSAVICVHDFVMCGYCELCTGYFEPESGELTTAAENQLCPTGAIVRKFIEEPYYEYDIDDHLCIGCGKCVKGCGTFGNGSLYLQVDPHHCVNCNECAIAVACPSEAFSRVPASQPYIRKSENESQ